MDMFLNIVSLETSNTHLNKFLKAIYFINSILNKYH